MTTVFTTIFGRSDSLKPAPAGADRSVCFVDDPSIYDDTRGWELVTHAATNPRREAWHLRCIPHRLFPEADQTVWIDASFTLTDLPRLLRDASGRPLAGLRHQARKTCYEEGREIIRIGQWDAAPVQRQLEQYRREGYRPRALTIACILVRQHTPAVAQFNERWDAEIQAHPSDNTQISLDYCAWKTGIGVHHLRGVRKDNPYSTHDHRDHKNRRKPYGQELAESLS